MHSYPPDAVFRKLAMNSNRYERNNGPPGSNNPRDYNAPGQYIYQGTTIKKVLDKNEACIPCRKRKTKCDVSSDSSIEFRLRYMHRRIQGLIGINSCCLAY